MKKPAANATQEVLNIAQSMLDLEGSGNKKDGGNINARFLLMKQFIKLHVITNHVKKDGSLDSNIGQLFRVLASERNSLAMLLPARAGDVKSDIEDCDCINEVMEILRDLLMHTIPDDTVWIKVVGHIAWSSSIFIAPGSSLSSDYLERLPSREEIIDNITANPWLVVCYILSIIDLSTD